ncbi:MAG: RluA family pseudouridine synthase, partial [Treponema sp.]|nr:RluA family pseudouridine synthase [Treponema sp.]
QLKFRVDLENRPHQIYDEEYGLLGITKWKKLGLETYIEPITNAKKKVTRIEFIPVTGRTHQLRLAASHKKGLGLPIIGDSLYGTCNAKQRLLLHAKELSFYHPTSNKLMHFYSKPEF